MAYLEELLPEFRKGARIRQKEWDKEVFIRFYKDEIYWYDDGAWKDGKIASHKDLVSIFTIHDNDWELYQEPIDWDYIIKNKCLCWFWDGCQNSGRFGILVNVNCDDENLCSSYKESWGDVWENCRPVRRDEVTFYEDKEDE